MASVFDLKGLLHIVEWVKALNNFDKDADYGVFANLLDVDTGRDSGQLLSDAAFRERTTRAGEARGLLRKFRDDIENHHPGGAASLFVDTLMDKTQWVEEDKLYKRQRSLAANYLTSGDYLRASIYAFEAIITAQVQERGGNPDRFEDREAAKADFENQNKPDTWNSYRQLRNLRNALAHGNPPSRRDIRQMMDSPECLRETLKCLIDTLLP